MIKTKIYKINKQLEMLFLSENNKEILITTFLFLYTSAKVVLSTLLSVFVIDTCEITTSFFEKCSFKERINNMTPFNVFVFGFNFFTLGIFVGFYILEFYREITFIKYLDINNNLPNNNLKTEIEDYKIIKNKILLIGNHYKNYSIILVIVNIINFIISLSLLYLIKVNVNIYINIISNILLTTDKLYSSLCIANKSLNDFIPYSAFVEEYVIFNTIDQNHKIKTLGEIDFIIQRKPRTSILNNMFKKYKYANSVNTIETNISDISNKITINNNSTDKIFKNFLNNYEETTLEDV